MLGRALVSIILLFALPATSALAQGEVLITQAKAIAGGVTPGDAAGFPVTLSQPGSYKLASNLYPGPGRDGIVVTSADVTIDLNGFVMSAGPAGGGSNSRYGIWGKGDRLTVRNGTIGAFKLAGIHAPARLYLIVENMRIINGQSVGIQNDGGQFARIQNSTIASNVGNGILCGPSCHVEGSVVSGNGAVGIRITTGMVLGNTVYSNGSYGVASVFTMGFGNNTIVSNNGGGEQVDGGRIALHPNACFPGAC